MKKKKKKKNTCKNVVIVQNDINYTNIATTK